MRLKSDVSLLWSHLGDYSCAYTRDTKGQALDTHTEARWYQHQPDGSSLFHRIRANLRVSGGNL